MSHGCFSRASLADREVLAWFQTAVTARLQGYTESRKTALAHQIALIATLQTAKGRNQGSEPF
jgi:hypothetical protein